MDHLSRSLLNTFTAQPLDRSAHGRKNSDWLTAQAANTKSYYVIFDGHSVVTVNRIPLVLSHVQFQTLDFADEPALLGLLKTHDAPVFMLNVTEPADTLAVVLDGLSEIIDPISLSVTPLREPPVIESVSLREIARDIDHDLASLYSYASLLNHWHICTRFCTRCGSTLVKKEGGSMQQCSSESCAHIEFPRINPAVIMRVTMGNKILLARQANWPEHRYSVLAGFVEVGETLEHAVAREVMEEVNIPVENINYHSSQPWPFPNSFMLGYTAEASSASFDLEQDDIEHALWLTAEEMKERMREGTVLPPPDLSISYSLINDWFVSETGISLKEFKSSLVKANA